MQTIEATLTVECGPILITGLSLGRTERGEPRCWFPRLPHGNRIVIRDRRERDQLLRLALESYRRITGRDFAETPLAKASSTKDTPS